MSGSGITQSVVKGGLYSSANYTWNEADVLGRGATADVYLGRKKDTGDVVAVKQFRRNIMFGQSKEAEKRELELLRKLNHKNVIRLFTIERQSATNVLVIIMEYCEGGSLHALLDQPIYSHGLPEEMFLLVLDNVVGGIKYLNQLGIIHRDIKPGNIMRCFQENGELLFKLTDFGAARELKEEENFTSMYGTEEYLYPAMYERAVLHLPTGQNFDAKVDLWSLGVTFYHCATGKLPFVPYGGRTNRETMFKIISQKESGVISGIQYFEDGPIHWSRELPQTCLLSGGLKSSLIALLSGLMEKDEYKMLTHEKMFDIVYNMCHKIAFSVFHYSMCLDLRVYCQADDTFSMLKDNIAAQTDIPANEQVLLLPGGRLLDYEIDQLAPIASYSKLILQSQLYVYNCTVAEHHELKFFDLPDFPDFSATYTDYERDLKIAFQCCSRTHFVKRMIENIAIRQKCLVEGEYALRSHISSKSFVSGEAFLGMERVVSESRSRFKMFFAQLENINGVLKTVKKTYRELEDIISDKTMLTVHEKAEERKNDIAKYKAVFMEKLDEIKIRNNSWVAVCAEHKCLNTVNHYCENITTTLGRFRRDRNVRSQMSPHDEKIHAFERDKLHRMSTKIMNLVNDHCLTNLQIMFSQAKPSLSALVKAYARIVKIERNIESVIDCQQLLSSRLDKLASRADDILNTVQREITQNRPPQTLVAMSDYDEGVGESVSQPPPADPQSIAQSLAEMRQDTEEMENLVHHSSHMLNRFSIFFSQPMFSASSMESHLD